MNEQKQFYMHEIADVFTIRKIVTIHYQALTNGYVAKEETHDFWEIVYADKGSATVVVNGVFKRLNAGEIVFIQPNASHYLESGKGDPNIFIVSFACQSKHMKRFRDTPLSVPENLRYLLQNIMEEATETFQIPDFDPDLKRLRLKKHPKLGGEQVIKNSLELFLIHLLRHIETRENAQKNPPEFFISKIASSEELQDEIVRILSEQIYGSFKLDDLCEKLHYGKTRLCTFFKKKTGMSIYQTYLKLKIDESKRLIRKKYSFSFVSYKLCFDSVSHFNRVFKKYAGMTPGEYKASIK